MKLWKARLQKVYDSFEEWECYCQMYHLHWRLGYKTAETAWRANPKIQGSVNPRDYGRAK